MDEPKFTQGLWNNCDGETIETKKARICIIAPLNLTQEESDANAALIAAAPEMYAKLKELADVLRFGGMRCTNRTMAQEIEEILKKARVKYD